jgi:hypothetical protein
MIGSSALNPAFNRTDPACLNVFFCTLADVMFVAATDPGQTWAKRVAKPTTIVGLNNPGPTTFAGWWTSLPSAPFVYVGLEIDKVGRTTGGTRGSLNRTCFDVTVDLTYRVLCSEEVTNASVGKGDSGSPVLFPEGPTQALAIGVLFAGGPMNRDDPRDGVSFCQTPSGEPCRYVYSPWFQIETHLSRFPRP